MSATETLPDLSIELDGASLSSRAQRSLSRVYVAQRCSLPTVCELTFLGPALATDVTEAGAIGNVVRVLVDGSETLFAGTIGGINHRYTPDGQRELRLRAYDALDSLRKRRPVSAHSARTLGELARSLVADLGLGLAVDGDDPAFGRIMQWHQSDLELLAEVAQGSGRYFFLEGSTLAFFTLEGRGEPISLAYGESLVEAEFDTNRAQHCERVEVRAWNPWNAAEMSVDAARPRRTQRAPDIGPSSATSTKAWTLVDQLAQSDEQARARAQVELDLRAASAVVARGVATGQSRLSPGRCIELDEITRPFLGRYVLTEVTHTIDRRSGYRVEFNSAPPRPRAHEPGAVSTLGRVTDVDDPEGLGRVRVQLPNYSDIETDWLAVVMPGAGRDKGLVALTDVGDRVLVILPHQDPGQGLVLGGLFGSESPPSKAGVVDGRVRSMCYRLPGGQQLVLDEEGQSVRLENGHGEFLHLTPGTARIGNKSGSYVELNEKRVRIHANSDLELAAPGRSVVFRSAKVDFQTG